MSDELFGSVGKIQTRKLFHKSSRRGKKNSKFLKQQRGGTGKPSVAALAERFGGTAQGRQTIPRARQDTQKLGYEIDADLKTKQDSLRTNLVKLINNETGNKTEITDALCYDKNSKKYKNKCVVCLDLLLSIEREIEETNEKLNSLNSITGEPEFKFKNAYIKSLISLYQNKLKELQELSVKVEKVIKKVEITGPKGDNQIENRSELVDVELNQNFINTYNLQITELGDIIMFEIIKEKYEFNEKNICLEIQKSQAVEDERARAKEAAEALKAESQRKLPEAAKALEAGSQRELQ